jgi:hypothetical protein
MDLPEIQSAYQTVMGSIAQRLLVADNALNEAECNPEHPNTWTSCELATVQIRVICELLLLSSSLAHLGAGESLDDRKWRPKDVFSELTKLSEHPLQIAVQVEFNKNGPGNHHIIPLMQPLSLDKLSRVYGICGDLLHAPSARQVLRQSLPSFDIKQIRSWLNGLIRLANGHALMLPRREKIILSIWRPEETLEPKCYSMAAFGESTFDPSSLPEFELLP